MNEAGEVVFDSVTINATDFKQPYVQYQGPRTGLRVVTETGREDESGLAETHTQEAPYVDGCNEETSYTYQLILSVGAQIATE